MEAICRSCNLSLKLPAAALPAGARLFCPKCSQPLEIRQDGPQAVGLWNNFLTGIEIPPVPPQPPSPTVSAPVPVPVGLGIPAAQLFSEDLVPDTEVGEDADKVRQNLFVKADSVWYGAPDKAPATPPSPPSGPPKIPQGTAPQQGGYIKATESIHVDPSLFAPVGKKEFQTPISAAASTPSASAAVGINAIPSGDGRMELALGSPSSAASLELAVTTPPHPSVSPTATPALGFDEKTYAAPPRQPSGPIKLVPTTVLKKSMNIAVPAIIVGVLFIAAALFYLLAGQTTTKEKFDITTNTSKTGLLPATSGSNAAPKPAPAAQAAPAAPMDTGKKAAQEHYSLGNQYFMQQRFDMSAEEYKAAIRADPSYAYAYRGLGAAYARLGKADWAVMQYETYIKLVPNAPDAEQVKKIINDYYGK